MVTKVTFWQQLSLGFSKQNYIIVAVYSDLGLFSWEVNFFIFLYVHEVPYSTNSPIKVSGPDFHLYEDILCISLWLYRGIKKAWTPAR